MGSDLSYSIALLNERDDGVVMSGIFEGIFVIPMPSQFMRGPHYVDR